MARKVYFAGELFDHKHLIGNRLLADAINTASAGRYLPVLPQESEPPEHRAQSIRNHDFQMLLECQTAIFNFDGTDLDSGTVVEFVTAKMLDLPAVLIRSDFRHCGDQETGGDPWNLMCSGYPRTVALSFNAMEVYQRHLTGSSDTAALVKDVYGELADKITAALDEVNGMPPLFFPEEELSAVYRQVIRAVGGGLKLSEDQLTAILRARLR